MSGLGFSEREALSPRDVALERLLMGLRTVEGVALAELTPLGLTAEAPRLVAMAEAGLIGTGGDHLVASPAGRRVLDRLTAELAA
jgi:oxygen-independent coproporphyrinogen-3 oxidase